MMLGSDVDGVQQAAPDGDKQDGDDMRLNRLDDETKALAGEPEPIAARASRTQKLLARRAVVASEHPSHESRKVAGARERPQIPHPVPLGVRARLDKAANPLEKSAVDAAASGEVGRRLAGVFGRHVRAFLITARRVLETTARAVQSRRRHARHGFE